MSKKNSFAEKFYRVARVACCIVACVCVMCAFFALAFEYYTAGVLLVVAALLAYGLTVFFKDRHEQILNPPEKKIGYLESEDE